MPFIHDKEPAAAAWRRVLEKPALLDPTQRQEIRRVLAQTPMSDLASLALGGLPGLPAVGGLVQGALNKDALTLWNKMARFVVETEDGPAKKESPEWKRANQAFQQLLSLPEGIELVQQLGGLFGDRDQPTFEIHFVDKLQKDFEGAGGYFVPEAIKNDTPMQGVFSREWPQGPGDKISSLSVDPASNMARTLHHELLHVWYLNTQSDQQYPTGHKDVSKREIAQLFWDRLEKFAEQQDDYTRPARERR
jgi:hypothetical protein